MSHVHRLRISDRIFFVTVNLRRAVAPLRAGEYAKLIATIDASRAKLGFKLNGYVLMPDHWHALLWTGYPLTISRAVQDIKWLSARELNGLRGTSGAVWQHQFWDRFVRHGKEFNDRLMYMHLNPVRKGLATSEVAQGFVFQKPCGLFRFPVTNRRVSKSWKPYATSAPPVGTPPHQ